MSAEKKTRRLEGQTEEQPSPPSDPSTDTPPEEEVEEVMIPDYIRPNIFGFADFIAKAFSIWLLFSNVLVGPWVREFVSKPLLLTELGANLFYVSGNKDDEGDDEEEEVEGEMQFFSRESSKDLKDLDPTQF